MNTLGQLKEVTPTERESPSERDDCAFSILAIDDEEHNLKILDTYLHDAGYKVFLATDGLEGLAILEQEHQHIDVILLDKMMPNMNGIEFIKNVRSNPNLPNIPIIMQSAAADKEAMVEGIKAGVFYYLTKPFEEDLLLSIVQAAASDYLLHEGLRSELHNHHKLLGMATKSEFEYQTLNQAKELATFVAGFFPDPDNVVLGLSELMINAVEHGNLHIGYDKKTELIKDLLWEQEIQTRLNQAENKDKKVHLSFQRGENEITLTITDQGDGFEWDDYMDISMERASDTHGRGIAMANTISFDKIEYLGCGNQVVCTVNI